VSNFDDDEPTEDEKRYAFWIGFVLMLWWTLWFLSNRGYL
jgi:hypothetical protein